MGAFGQDNPTRERIFCNACPSLPDILALLRKSDPIGRKGDYVGVHRLSLVNGGYTPVDGANPFQGTVGVPERAPLIEFSTWAPATAQEAVDKFVAGLEKLHPFEEPLIEITLTKQWEQERVSKLGLGRPGGARLGEPK